MRLIAGADDRRDGRVPARLLRKALGRSTTLRLEVAAVAVLLLLAAVAHGVNMGNFPYYEDDEGTYVSQAWSILNGGQLSPYYYIYDHPPAGWLQLAAWFSLTGGMNTFGTTIESGRALMLLMQVGSTLMVYLVARALARRPWVALLAGGIFALSAYGIYYHRRVLLDNIATLWVLASLVLVARREPRLHRFVLAGAAFGIAVLSKEVVAVLGPALVLFAISRASDDRRLSGTVAWVASSGVVVALYPLYALRRGELFTGGPTGISLIGTLQQQAARGTDGGMLDPNSAFWRHLSIWAKDAPLLVVGGTIAAFVLIAAARWHPAQASIGLATILYWSFLGRGGETLSFYVLPLLPLLALDVGLVLALAERGIRRLASGSARWPASLGAARARTGFVGLSTLVLAIGLVAGYTSGNPELGGKPLMLWQGTHAVGQREAIRWVIENLPPDSRIITDMYAWTDLREVPAGGKPFTSAEYYWKVDLDPTVREKVFRNDWRTVDYVIATPQVVNDANGVGSLTIVRQALAHSHVVATFGSGSGWPVQIRKVDSGS